MPIGGGKFTVMNKVLPGAYINFVSKNFAMKMGERGVCALPLELNWGPEEQVFTLYADEFSQKAKQVLAYDSTSADILLVREAMKRASALLIYRVNSGGAKATATAGGLTATALWAGTRGNDLRVAVLQNVDVDSMVDVVTYLDGEEVDLQTVNKTGGGSALIANDYVSFAGSNLTAAAAVALAGGTNGTVNGAAHTKALEALEKETFSVIGYPGTDETTKKIYAAYVQRLRDDEGYKIVGVLPNYKGDYEGLINVKNGVILDDGMVIPAEKAVAWVAGASAAAEVWESLTNTAYDDAVGADIKYSKTEYKQAVQNGEFVFYTDTDCARVLTDINCLTTFGLTKTEDWTSNRLVRVLDGWANDVAKAYGETYLGKQNNNPAGRDLFKADVVNLGAQYEAREAITDFKADDVVISQGAGKRDVVAECVIQPVDSMEKLYMTVNVI